MRRPASNPEPTDRNSDATPARVTARIERAMTALRKRHRAARLGDAAVRNFLRDRGSLLAATIAYYAFFSLFPLLLVFTTVLGFVLQNDPARRDQLIDSALGRVPVLGEELAKGSHAIGGSGLALVIGLLLAVWAGLGVVNATQHAVDVSYELPFVRQAGYLRRRLRSLVTLVLLGVAFLALTLTANVATSLGDSALVTVGLVAVSLVITAAAFAGIFAVVSTGHHRLRDVWPGAICTAVAWVTLQAVGGVYVEHVVDSASATYGVFAIVIGLLAWLHVLAHAVVLGLELNAAHAGRTVPTPSDPPEPA